MQSPAAEAAALLDAPKRALARGRPDEAMRLLERLLQERPDCAEAHVLLGTLHQRRGNYDEARDSYVLAACHDPASWVARYNLGLLLTDEGRAAEAEAELSKASELAPCEARIWNALGVAALKMGRADAAAAHFRQAVALEPGSADAHSNLGHVLFRYLESFDEGARRIEQALRLDPMHVEARCNWTMVLQHRGELDRALTLCDALLEENFELVEARLDRALILLKQGDYARGWREYEVRRVLYGASMPSRRGVVEWNGEDIHDKSVWIQPEQGLGDEIMFASCVPDVIARAERCILQCQPRLAPLFRRSLPEARVVVSAEEALALAPDRVVLSGSLPRLLRLSRADFPGRAYLAADANRAQHWRRNLAALPGRLKVGISWRGGAASTRQSLRSIALEQWAPILALREVDFVSLQYTPCAEERAQVERTLGVRIHYWQEAIDDYDETAALVAALDLVISVQTALVHLGGALGQRVWALISAVPEWRYGAAGIEMPWYPRVELERQQTLGNWTPVIAAVRERLDTMLRS